MLISGGRKTDIQLSSSYVRWTARPDHRISRKPGRSFIVGGFWPRSPQRAKPKRSWTWPAGHPGQFRRRCASRCRRTEVGTPDPKWLSGRWCMGLASGIASQPGPYQMCVVQRTLFSQGHASLSSSMAASGMDVLLITDPPTGTKSSGERRSNILESATPRRIVCSMPLDGLSSASGNMRGQSLLLSVCVPSYCQVSRSGRNAMRSLVKRVKLARVNLMHLSVRVDGQGGKLIALPGRRRVIASAASSVRGRGRSIDRHSGC